MLERQGRSDIAQNVPHHQRLQSNANCLLGVLRYLISHNLFFATFIPLEICFFSLFALVWLFFSSDSTIQTLVTADFVSLTTDFRCKLLVTKCPEKAFTLLLFLLWGEKKCLRQILEVLGFWISPQNRWDSSKWTKKVSDTLSFLNSRQKKENGKVLMEILTTMLYLKKKTNKLVLPLCCTRWKYILK